MRKNGGRQRLCVCVSFTFRCFRFFVSRLFFFFFLYKFLRVRSIFGFHFLIKLCVHMCVCHVNITAIFCDYVYLFHLTDDCGIWARVCALFFCLQFYAKHWRPLCSLIDLQWLVQFLATVHHFRWDQRIVLPSRARRRKKKSWNCMLACMVECQSLHMFLWDRSLVAWNRYILLDDQPNLNVINTGIMRITDRVKSRRWWSIMKFLLVTNLNCGFVET